MRPRVAAVIPARFESTRLPGKPLADILGKPMVWRVYEQAERASLVNEVWVATDDRRVYDAVRELGGNALMTDPSHPSGTDRVAEAARGIDADLYVNVQGDEPVIPPGLIDEAVRPLIDNPALNMGTAARRTDDAAEIADPSIVKVVLDESGCAMYFSRSPIPYHRDEWAVPGEARGGECLKHVGIYVYRKDFLFRYAAMEPTTLERTEKLEQLRALGHGERIKVVITGHESIGVDTPEDLERVISILSQKEKSG